MGLTEIFKLTEWAKLVLVGFPSVEEVGVLPEGNRLVIPFVGKGERTALGTDEMRSLMCGEFLRDVIPRGEMPPFGLSSRAAETGKFPVSGELWFVEHSVVWLTGGLQTGGLSED